MTPAVMVAWPLFVAAVLMVQWRHGRWQRWGSVVGAVAHVGFGVALLARVMEDGPIQQALGGWRAPFGIEFLADRLGAVMALVAAVIGVCIAAYAVSGIDSRREAYGFHPLVHVLLGAVCGAFLTHDYFNLYVWFEVMLMASFVLLALGGERRQLRGAMLYVALNLLGSMMLLAGIAVVYGLTGTLNMSDVAARLPMNALADVACALLAFAFAAKAAVFPLFGWLPPSYSAPPTVVTALFSGLLTKVGIVSLLRALATLFPTHAPWLLPTLIACGILTMLLGVLGAVGQNGFRRVLAVHIISQIGYVVAAGALGSVAGLASAIYFLLSVVVVKTSLFLIGGIARRRCGSEELAEMGGLWRATPGLSVLFLVAALGLAGVPPLSGFWAKVFVLHGAFAVQEYAVVGIGLLTSFFTLFSMVKLWNEAFWKPLPGEPSPAPTRVAWRYGPVVVLVAASLALGLAAGPVYSFCLAAAGEIQP